MELNEFIPSEEAQNRFGLKDMRRMRGISSHAASWGNGIILLKRIGKWLGMVHGLSFLWIVFLTQ